MLHSYQEAARAILPYEHTVEQTAGRQLLLLLYEINEWLHEMPAVSGSHLGKTLYILYRNVSYPVQDIEEQFARPMALLSQSRPVRVFGTAPNQETVCLSAEVNGNQVQFVQRSISGKPSDVAEMLCLQLDCTDCMTAEALTCLLQSINWKTGIAAIPWKYSDLFGQQQLIWRQNIGCQFCYAGLAVQPTLCDYLLSLDFVQKISLWMSFLKERAQPLEFEWISQAMSEGVLYNRMEWELALREAMEQLGYQVVNEEKSFALYDGRGRRIYIGADGKRTAQWVLIKMLFPLNYS